MRTFSFYRFCDLASHDASLLGGLRSTMLTKLGGIGVVGRIYLSRHEGVNGLCSLSDTKQFRETLGECAPELGDMPLNEALEQGPAFTSRRLHVRWRKTLVNCGAAEPGLDRIVAAAQRTATLDAASWNAELDNDKALLIDARNGYETEVGRMEGARARVVGAGAKTFRDQIEQLLEELRQAKAAETQPRILMFCTSGIRCEKLAAVLEEHGHSNVAQLGGGVTAYVRTAREQGLPLRFRGRLFTFDDRIGADVTDEALGKCHLCGSPARLHHNCEFLGCHNLNLQCEACYRRLLGACSEPCMESLLGKSAAPVQMKA